MAKVLQAKREQLKGKLTRLQSYVHDVTNTEITLEIINELKCRLEKFENPVWAEFDDTQSQLEIRFPSETDEAERFNFENEYFKLIAKIKSLCVNVNTSNSVDASSSQNKHNSIQIKLPAIQLKTFDGKYENWLEFRDSFNALVENNDTLTNIQRFYYLRSSLEKEPAQIIKSIEVSADNYQVAWKLLLDRYENKPLIIHNHINAIFELPSIKRESHVELRSLFDNLTKHLRALKILGENTDEWDRLIIYILNTKFDHLTRREWETYDYSAELPSMKDMNNFLKSKCNVLEKLEMTKNEKPKVGPVQKISQAYPSVNNANCFFCNDSHAIYNCPSFLKLSIEDRIANVKKVKRCLNCLRSNHFSNQCRSNTCRKCRKPHNSLLHLDTNSNGPVQSNTNENSAVASDTEPSATISNHASMQNISSSQVLLSTAMVKINDNKNKVYTCRALLDSGSQSHFISEHMCRKLNLKPTKVEYVVKGVGQALSNINKQVNIRIWSTINSFNVEINCLVLPIITEELPTITVTKNVLNIPEHLPLADKEFHKSKQIDLLIGSGVFWSLLCVGQYKLGSNMPIMQKTQLGWIIAGNLNYNQTGNTQISCFSINSFNDSISDNTITKVWELEEVEHKSGLLSESEEYCENYFSDTTIRNSNGRFVLKIPFKENLLSTLGNSREIALNRFKSLERKLMKDEVLKKKYTEFMVEYEKLGHMSEIKESETSNVGYFLPHHAVIKTDSLTTKLRVVFDGSCKTDNGVSLNEIQHIGPALQNDIFAILLRFRTYKYVITADISKMYRQILISEEHREYQKIFWRSEPQAQLKCYKLNTLTYGTASAPYLAIRCIHQLAINHKTSLPLASKVIKNDFYVDDLLTGANSLDEIIELQRDITDILASAGFQLRKWSSNDKNVINRLNINREVELGIIELGSDETTNKTLGIYWNPNLDSIQYKIRDISAKGRITKRSILSTIAKIYDPLGLLGPIIITFKLIIQELWKIKISWDETIPQYLHTKWLQLKNELDILNEVQIPRHVIPSNYEYVELHGFSDASESAYGACVYLRSIGLNETVSCNLLCAKSRVAPVKSVSLPRLELCAALLLANLVQVIVKSNINFNKKYFWVDSKIALAWIQGPPNKWKTFIRNSVAEIQTLTELAEWRYVRSAENPADLISRGVSPHCLKASTLWWHGPSWLLQGNLQWASTKIFDTELEHSKLVHTSFIANGSFVFERYSSLIRLKRTVAYLLRFRFNLKADIKDRQTGQLTRHELDNALTRLIQISQRECYSNDVKNLQAKKPLDRKSKLLSLNTYLDDKGLIRVGGRLNNSNQNYDTKHPIILPQGHTLTKLILTNEHERLFHCGAQHLLYSIRQRFWPIAGRSAAKNVVRKCIICFKAAPKLSIYQMGNLPAVRVNEATPFENVGVDYGGPFLMKDRKLRGAKLIKVYLCLFVCMCTKAVHLELVSELTTNAFMATFYRFIARRGKPSNVYSDNGKNFVGANNKLREIFKFLQFEKDSISNHLLVDNIQWHFIPSYSPNFGGLWEAGIKMTKWHLKRVIGEAKLTFEEFYTVLAQIESILNSRPLSPLSSDINDLSALTPAHFLIGKSLTALPEPNTLEIRSNRMNKYEQMQAMRQHFWKRWHKEVVSELQTRCKWRQLASTEIKIGDLVVIKDDNAPALKWSLGRVTQLHPGADGITRVISIKVMTGVIKRAITQVCVLPIER